LQSGVRRVRGVRTRPARGVGPDSRILGKTRMESASEASGVRPNPGAETLNPQTGLAL